MFDLLQPLPADSILHLGVEYRQDQNPDKVDLGVGVYRDENGVTPVMAAVNAAQSQLHDKETSKAYGNPAGLAGFNHSIIRLLLGETHPAITDNRVVSVQTPGGCGALNLAGHLIHRCHRQANRSTKVWVSTPTWANHIPLLGSCGLQLRGYAYYDHDTHHIDFSAMMQDLSAIAAGDVVLLHGCCHNPSGVDLTTEQWQHVIALINEKGALPLLDIAYQGLGEGLTEDAWSVRYIAEHCPEVIIASSCSKNFGLYRERVGAVLLVAQQTKAAETGHSQLVNIARGIYSMPPHHGAALVDIILGDKTLTQQWQTELTHMRQRIDRVRATLVSRLQAAGAGSRFDHIGAGKGMFSFLGITSEQVQRLRQQSSIYMVESSRINVAGLHDASVDYFVSAMQQAELV